jgi:hypothetical protein
MIAYIPLICLVAGLLLWALAKSDPWKSIGQWMFICALLALLIAMSPATVKMLTHSK